MCELVGDAYQNGVVGDGRISKFLVITISVSNLVIMYTCYAMPLHYF